MPSWGTPNLIHKADITIEQIDRTNTIYDQDAREPIQAAKRKPSVTLKGQPRWIEQAEQLEVTPIGPTKQEQGYVMFRYVDLQAKGIVLQMNDRITKIGHRTFMPELYITRVQDVAHYENGAEFTKAWFSDRAPAKER
jgi:hypothetical protein